jgi:hypothetical protein
MNSTSHYRIIRMLRKPLRSVRAAQQPRGGVAHELPERRAVRRTDFLPHLKSAARFAVHPPRKPPLPRRLVKDRFCIVDAPAHAWRVAAAAGDSVGDREDFSTARACRRWRKRTAKVWHALHWQLPDCFFPALGFDVDPELLGGQREHLAPFFIVMRGRDVEQVGVAKLVQRDFLPAFRLDAAGENEQPSMLDGQSFELVSFAIKDGAITDDKRVFVRSDVKFHGVLQAVARDQTAVPDLPNENLTRADSDCKGKISDALGEQGE